MIQFGVDFSTNGVPETGLSPIITIRDTSDGSVAIDGVAMTEVGGGAYKYDFTNDTAKKYSIVIDGGVDTLDSRYMTAWSERAKAEAETVLILADTNELQTDDIPTSIAAIKAETALIVADTNELQTDDIPGTLATIAGYIDTEIGTIVTAVETTIPNSIAALPTDADVNAACDLAISDAALATAAILKEVNQSLNGAKCIVDRAANTFKVYDTDGTTLLFTITKSTSGNVDTLTRT